jgi:hypothetical protein
MSSAAETAGGLSKRGRRRAREHAEFIIEELPPAGVGHTITEWADAPTVKQEWRGPYESLARTDALATATVVEAPGRSTQAHIRELRPAAAAIAREQLRNDQPPCPCGHRGLRNPVGVDGYRCGWARCEKTFQRVELDDPAGLNRIDCIAPLKRLADGLNAPTMSVVNRDSTAPPAATIREKFGTWNAAAAAAGLKLTSRAGRRHTDAELGDWLRAVGDKSVAPSISQVDAHPDAPASSTYHRRFGSWNAALEAAGYGGSK